ncbi:MAG: sugar ABC transporter permease [Ardenticatenia bacterium]|nr:MAG: sugar ABC transporter permease [Ardenticatenia bacterium]
MSASKSISLERSAATGKRRFTLTNTQFSIILLLPALLTLAFTVLYPLLRGIYLSFHSYSLVDLVSGIQWVGLENFKTLLSSSAYRSVWGTTLIFVAGSVGGQFVVGFLTALVLNQDLAQRNLFRGLLLMPWIVPTVVAALLWKWIFNQQYGIFNYVLHSLGLISSFKAWIGDPSLALFSVTLANIWKGFPFHMIVLLAALQTIPPDIIEAAIIDGTTAVQRFRYVVLPYLRYIIMIDLLISIIWTFQSFTTIWTMTEGGPVTATTTLAISIYRTAFQAFDIGMGAAIGTLWLVAMLVFSAVFVRLFGGTRLEV